MQGRAQGLSGHTSGLGQAATEGWAGSAAGASGARGWSQQCPGIEAVVPLLLTALDSTKIACISLSASLLNGVNSLCRF